MDLTNQMKLTAAGPSVSGSGAARLPLFLIRPRQLIWSVNRLRVPMPAEFDIRPMVQKNSSLPMERLRVLSRFEDIGLRAMRRGIVFAFAAWSGPAVLALRRFTQIMAELPTGPLDLVVLDIDCLSADSATELFGTSGFRAGGYGETIWVRDGVIVAREVASPAGEHSLRAHTIDLLDEHKG